MRSRSKNLSPDNRGPRHTESMLNRTLPQDGFGPGANTMFDQATAGRPHKRRNRKKIFKRIFLTLCIVALVAGGWVGWKAVSNSAKIFGWSNLFGLFSKTKLDGEDEGRVNILLAGNSADDPGHGGADLTDSIMIMSINTTNNTAFLLSIPRDLYVDIPDNGYAKINEAYQDGERGNFSESGYASGGMGLLEKTVSQHFDIKLHYYALVNYTALREAVNAVGGIKINVQSSNPKGLYDPSPDLATGQPLVDLPNGWQTLDGQQALGLARSRGDSYYAYGFPRGDFDRTTHQRQILVALKEKAGSVGTLSNPLKVGQLFDSFGNNVKTDLELNEARRLYDLLKKVPSDAIISASLSDGEDHNLLQSYTTRFGQSALIPKTGVDDFSEIQAYVQQLTAK